MFVDEVGPAGGFSAVDMALHGIARKIYGVAAYRLAGEKVRDRIRIYCDTTPAKDPKVFAQRILQRKQAGFTCFKMDVGAGLVRDRPGALRDGAPTGKGLGYMGEYIATGSAPLQPPGPPHLRVHQHLSNTRLC